MAYKEGSYTAELIMDHRRNQHRDPVGSYTLNCPMCVARIRNEFAKHDEGEHAEAPSKWCDQCDMGEEQEEGE